MYQIQIIKFEKRSEEEIKEIEDAHRYNRDFPTRESPESYPNYIDRNKYKSVKALDVELTDEEFKSIKKSVIEIM